MRKVLSVLLCVVLLLGVFPLGSVTAADTDGFALFSGGKAADLYVSDTDHAQIIRAAGDLQQDVQWVTGVTPALKNQTGDLGEYAVIIGSVEKSPVIAQLIADGKLDEAKAIEGKFEAFAIQTVDNPLPGVKKALVIAGSDKRGTIYGIYDMSERIGVSPYYWWADVTPKQQEEILLPDGVIHTEGEPSVKYRGIFLNDERNFMEWSEKFTDSAAGGKPNSGAYEKVFELLLRLKANTLWPAMHNYSTAFNKYQDANGVPINAKIANDYGIIMGSSHCEMLLRNNEGEWSSWASANAGKYDASGTPVYDFTVNPKALEAYWRERVEKNKDFEGIYNIGMRGIHDSGMTFKGLSNPTLADKIAVLQDVIDCQRKILSEVLGKPADQIPQAFIPYKEVADYYNGDANTPGVQVPEDVILMWAEDNHGYIRQIPTEAERKRSGGSGVYYHVSYWGVANTSYLWLNTTPLSLMYEELKKAYDTGCQSYWILNVGDLKPSEISMEFMMRLARDIDFCDDTTIEDYLAKVAGRDFLTDEKESAEIADIMTKYYQYNIAKRPEFQGYESKNGNDPYSIVNNGDEAQIRVNQLFELVNRAAAIYENLDLDRRDAFYEMVYYPLRSSANNLAMNVYWQKNQLYAKQGRYASVEKYQTLSVQAYNNIVEDLAYYNKTIGDGKWDKIINPYNNTNGFPVVVGLQTFATVSEGNAVPGIGAVCEGQEMPTDAVTLKFSSLSDNRRFVDIYSREDAENNWTIEVSDDFIVPEATSGSVRDEVRVWIGIDWDKAADGENTGTVTVKDEKGNRYTFNVSAYKSTAKLDGKVYAEENGVVAIEAEHYTESVAAQGSEWKVVENLGRNGDSMKVYPELGRRIDSNFATIAAQLKYDIYFEHAGTFTATLYRIPTLNEGKENGVEKTSRIAVGMEGDQPQVLSGVRTCVDVNKAWIKNTLEHIEKLTFTVQVDKPGVHTLVVYQSDAGIAFDRLVINTGGEMKSYLGPQESYNTVSFEKAPEGTLPAADSLNPEKHVELYRSELGISEPIEVTGGVHMETGEYLLLDALPLSDGLDMGDVNWQVEMGGDVIDLLVRDDNKAAIGARNVGKAVIRVTAEADSTIAKYCTVVVSETPDVIPAEYMETDGKVLIDVTTALEQSEYANLSDRGAHAWRLNGDGNALTIQSDVGIGWDGSASASTAAYDSQFLNNYAPQLNFQIYFEHAGTYYIHTLSSHPKDSSDSTHFGLDGVWQFHTNHATHNGNLRWEKRDAGWFITVSEPGVHTLNVWPREDGTVSHRIYLVNAAGQSYFDGWGPAESGRRMVETGDKTALRDKVNANKYRVNDGYSNDSWAAYTEAYKTAKAVLSDNYASQAVIDSALENLDSAIRGLPRDGQADVAAAIEALLGAYPLTDKSVEESVRAVYDALSDTDKTAELEAVLAVLAEESDAADVQALIGAIGNVTYKSGSAIRTARAAYDALTADEQKSVGNYQTLLDAESAMQAIADAFQVTVTGWDNRTFSRTPWMKDLPEEDREASRQAMADEMKYQYVMRGYRLGITSGTKAVDANWGNAPCIGFGSPDDRELNDNLGNPWWQNGDTRHWAYVSTSFPGISFSENGYFACKFSNSVPLSNSFAYEGRVYQMFTGGLRSHEDVEPVKSLSANNSITVQLNNTLRVGSGGNHEDVTNNTFLYAYARFNQAHKWEERTVGIPAEATDPKTAAGVLYKAYVGPNGDAFIAGDSAYITSSEAAANKNSGKPTGAYVIAGEFAEILQSLGNDATAWFETTGAPLSDEYETAEGIRQDFVRGYMIVSEDFTGFVGRSEDDMAADVMDQITALPAVDALKTTDAAAVEAVRKAYDQLTKESKELVDNYDKLTQLETRLSDLYAAGEVDALITALMDALSGEPMRLALRPQTLAAQQAYEVLNEVQQSLVSQAEKLNDLLDALNTLQKGVDDMAALIEGLPEPSALTAADTAAVQDAWDAFHALTDEQQIMVVNSEKLWLLKAKADFDGGDDTPLDSDIYTILRTDSGNYITGIAVRTTAETLADGFNRDVTLKLQNGETVATGDSLRAAGEVFTLIVTGDVNGDGKVDVSDIMQVKNAIMREKFDTLQLLAGDLDGSGTLAVADIMGLKNLIMKGA